VPGCTEPMVRELESCPSLRRSSLSPTPLTPENEAGEQLSWGLESGCPNAPCDWSRCDTDVTEVMTNRLGSQSSSGANTDN